jgi:hypothetical protein
MTAKPTAGQPNKATPELARRIAALVSSGTKLADAAEQCGLDRSSLFNYRKLGKAGQEPYASFEAIIKAAALGSGRK